MSNEIKHSHEHNGGDTTTCIGCYKQQIMLEKEVEMKLEKQSLVLTNQLLELKKDVKNEFIENAATNDKHFNRIYDVINKLSDIYTRKECDDRFASKDVEKNINKITWLIVSAVMLAIIALVLAPK